MSLDQTIAKIPKPVLVFCVIAVSLVFFVYLEPLKDDCQIKTDLFDKSTRGILFSTKTKSKKTHFAMISYWQQVCQQGNSIGACNDYFTGLRTVADSLMRVPDKCYPKYIENNPEVLRHIKSAIKTMALVAWGERPPAGLQNRSGWLTDADVSTFCKLKHFVAISSAPEEFQLYRDSIYLEFPDIWPEHILIEDRDPMDRPKAFKTRSNPQGSLNSQEVYERSLFSYRCDLYQ